MIPQKTHRVGVFLFGALLGLGCLGETIQPEPVIDRLKVDLPVTNGLIRWWPNLFDARDEISGQEGVVMGILPPVKTGADDETEFGPRARWVQLQPAISNQVFTLTFWVRCGAESYFGCRLLAQESSAGQWIFEANPPLLDFFVSDDNASQADWSESVSLKRKVWQHVAVARRADGTSLVWVDGARALEGHLGHYWPATSRWLSVGNGVKGDSPFEGAVRDLCAFERVLTDAEVSAIHAAGLPRRPARNSPARLAATGRALPVEVSTNVASAPPRSWVHRRFTTEEGLPDNSVKAVLQARNGYLWVGTQEGLARFDGRHFQNFTAENTPALAAIGQTIWSLAEDTDGTIWAGVFGGLLRIRGLEFTAFTNGLPQRFVLQAEPTGDGSVWVAGFNTSVPRGPCWLRRYHPEWGTCSAAGIVPGQLRRLVVVTNGVWLASEQPQQMYFWDGHSPAPRTVGTVSDLPTTILMSSNATVGTGYAVSAWAIQGEITNYWAQIKCGSDGPTFDWLWDSRHGHPWTSRWAGPRSDEAWLGVTYDLARVQEGRLQTYEIAEFQPGPEISCMCANREGGAWFGTQEDGLHFVQEQLIRVFTTRDGMAANDVRSVAVGPDGALWAATSHGISISRTGAWTRVDPRWPLKLRTVAVDREGNAWFGDEAAGQFAIQRHGSQGLASVISGLDWHDPNTFRFARDGTLWVVCERGLSWLKPAGLLLDSQTNWVPNPSYGQPIFGRYAIGKELPIMRPLGLIEDRDGSFWMGSLDHGLFHIADGRVKNLTSRDGLPGHRCVPVLLDDSGALWIVSENGLCRRRAGHFQNASAKDGLPKDILLDLIEDGLGNFWISGKRGIHRVARQELEAFFAGKLNQVHSLTLGIRDGLLTPECSNAHQPTMARTADGRIWVATLNGLATFDPGRIHLDTQPLPALIERVLVDGGEVQEFHSSPTGKPLKLAPGSGENLRFDFTAISLLDADRLRFRHWLEGSETQWSAESDLRLAFYTNLKPGKYRFHVKAANAHGIWSRSDTVVSFVILPYFWQTSVFYVVVAVAVGGLAGAVHWRRLAAQGRLQELRHQQELTSEKARIAADMHDELGAALTQIAILGEVAKGQSANPVQTRSTLDRISEAARDVTSRISDLVWATNPRNDTLDNLAAYLREYAASELESTTMRPRLEFPQSLPETRVSATFRRNLLLILKESLHNVLKHSKAREVFISLAVTESGLELRIQDDGQGFEPGRQTRAGNGLGNMRNRATDLGGEFGLNSAPGKGTQIKVRLPLDGWGTR